MESLKTKSMKRLAALAAGVALPLLNRKLGLELTPGEITEVMVLIGGYILQSVANDMHARSKGLEAAAEVKTAKDAMRVMEEVTK